MTPTEVHLHIASPKPPQEPHATLVVHRNACKLIAPLTVAQVSGLVSKLKKAECELRKQGRFVVKTLAVYLRGFDRHCPEVAVWGWTKSDAKVFTNKDAAVKAAKKASGRVVRLVPKRGT